MVSELTILHLQPTAALLMGYDYFLSDWLKEKANEKTAELLRNYHSQLDVKIKEQFNAFRHWKPLLIKGGLYALGGVWLLMLFIGLIKSDGPLFGFLAFVVFFLLLFSLARALEYLFNAIKNGILPFVIPGISRFAISFLLYSSKGSVAAFGMMFLIASFVCRYLNIKYN